MWGIAAGRRSRGEECAADRRQRRSWGGGPPEAEGAGLGFPPPAGFVEPQVQWALRASMRSSGGRVPARGADHVVQLLLVAQRHPGRQRLHALTLARPEQPV